jgi:hypothetical protein
MDPIGIGTNKDPIGIGMSKVISAVMWAMRNGGERRKREAGR